MKFVMETRLMNTIRKPMGEDENKEVFKQPSTAEGHMNLPDSHTRVVRS